jgi:hypothetical protein
MAGANIREVVFGWMRYSPLESDTIHSNVMMDVVSRLQASLIYFPATEIIQPIHDSHKGIR